MQVFEDYFGNNAFKEGFSMYPLLMRPKSRGRISLKSSDPKDYPLIQPNYLKHPDDIKILIEGTYSTLVHISIISLFKHSVAEPTKHGCSQIVFWLHNHDLHESWKITKIWFSNSILYVKNQSNDFDFFLFIWLWDYSLITIRGPYICHATHCQALDPNPPKVSFYWIDPHSQSM